MNFIKRVFDGKEDDSVHLQFQKFSKGEFRQRACIQAKSSAGKYTIFAGPEFANDLVKDMAQKLGSTKTNVTGVVVSTGDLTGQLDFKSKKQFMGIKQYGVDKEMSGNEIIVLLNKLPKAFFALSFKANDSELKIKPKAPKSAKPSTKEDDTIKVNFCKLVTTDKKLAQEFVFEGDFKKAEVRHTFFINEIIPPKDEKDFSKIRELAKRKGKIVRETDIDGKKSKVEKEFIS
jgi:hypothetical protein